MFNYFSACTFSPYLELLNSRRTECISRSNDDLFALRCEPCRKLSYGSGLACTVNTDNKYYGRLCGKIELFVLSKHTGDYLLQLVLYKRRLFDALFLYSLSQLRADVNGGLNANVAHNKSFFKLLKEVLVDFCERVKQGIYLSHHRVTGFSYTLCNFFKKSHSNFSLKTIL